MEIAVQDHGYIIPKLWSPSKVACDACRKRAKKSLLEMQCDENKVPGEDEGS